MGDLEIECVVENCPFTAVRCGYCKTHWGVAKMQRHGLGNGSLAYPSEVNRSQQPFPPNPVKIYDRRKQLLSASVNASLYENHGKIATR